MAYIEKVSDNQLVKKSNKSELNQSSFISFKRTIDTVPDKANKLGEEDIEITDSSKGVILKDRGNGKRYKLFVEDDNFGIEEI
jgi:hypothetical protein